MAEGEASALMPMPLRCLTKSPTERFFASTLPFIREWLLARLVQAVALTMPFFLRMRAASCRTWSGLGLGLGLG